MQRFLFNFFGAFIFYGAITAAIYLFFWLLRSIIDTGLPTWAVVTVALTGLSLMFALVMTLFGAGDETPSLQE